MRFAPDAGIEEGRRYNACGEVVPKEDRAPDGSARTVRASAVAARDARATQRKAIRHHRGIDGVRNQKWLRGTQNLASRRPHRSCQTSDLVIRQDPLVVKSGVRMKDDKASPRDTSCSRERRKRIVVMTMTVMRLRKTTTPSREPLRFTSHVCSMSDR